MESILFKVIFKKKRIDKNWKLKIEEKFKKTRLLVSAQSPECSDCFLRFYGAVITLKN